MVFTVFKGAQIGFSILLHREVLAFGIPGAFGHNAGVPRNLYRAVRTQHTDAIPGHFAPLGQTAQLQRSEHRQAAGKGFAVQVDLIALRRFFKRFFFAVDDGRHAFANVFPGACGCKIIPVFSHLHRSVVFELQLLRFAGQNAVDRGFLDLKL